MAESTIREFMEAAHDCAMAMLENASYIQSELPNVEIPEALRSQADTVCSSLIGTKHDVISELFELDEVLASGAATSAALVRVNRILRWLWEDIPALHQLVIALKAANEQNPAYGSAYVLVTESAVNIVNVFNRTKAISDSIEAGE